MPTELEEVVVDAEPILMEQLGPETQEGELGEIARGDACGACERSGWPGSAFLSTFPFAVSGSDSNTTSDCGTMYSGSTALSPCLTTSAWSTFPGRAVTYPTSRFCEPSSRATTTASPTPSCFSSPASTSPSSMR